MWHYVHRMLKALKFILDHDMFISILNEMERKLEDTLIIFFNHQNRRKWKINQRENGTFS
jgi:hypothetical protein